MNEIAAFPAEAVAIVNVHPEDRLDKRLANETHDEAVLLLVNAQMRRRSNLFQG